jgi:hypothetical protein
MVVNLAEVTRTGQAQISSPSGSVLGMDRFVDVRYVTVTDADPSRGAAGTSTRQWLYLHPPSDVAIDVTLPRRTQLWFQAALALDPSVWATDVGDGVRYRATVAPLNSGAAGGATATAGPATTVVDQIVDPRTRKEQRRFVPVVADLSPWAGQTVRLTLATDSRQDLSFDWAGWADPIISVVDSDRDPLSRGR